MDRVRSSAHDPRPLRLPPISIDAGFSVNCPLLNPLVGVAQLVERRSVAPNVAGSIPVAHPNLTLQSGFTTQPLNHAIVDP
jgi:hypothetical protein